MSTSIGNDYPSEDPKLDPSLLCSFRASLVIRGVVRVFRFCSTTADATHVPTTATGAASTGGSGDATATQQQPQPYHEVTGFTNSDGVVGPDSAVKHLISRIMVLCGCVIG